jgi:CSLREA domain-containing protein
MPRSVGRARGRMREDGQRRASVPAWIRRRGVRGAACWLAVVAATVGVGGFAAPPALADSTVTVTTTSDEEAAGDGTCSLREAIVYANGFSGSNQDCAMGMTPSGTTTIKLPASSSHYLLNGMNVVSSAAGPVVIAGEGAGPTGTTIDAAFHDRAFEILGGDTTIASLTITGGGGAAPFQDGAGGAGILNQGTLTLRDVVVTGNTAQPTGRGGGIMNEYTGAAGSGVLTLVDSTVSNNAAGNGRRGHSGHDCLGGEVGNGTNGADGGGVYNYRGTVTVIGTTITGNMAGSDGDGGHGGVCSGGRYPQPGGAGGNGGSGAGIFNDGGRVTVPESTIDNNHAGAGGAGGAGAVGGAGGAAGSGYHAPDGAGGAGGDGGGIVTNGALTVVNATIGLNRAGDGGPSKSTPGAGGNGGGILQRAGYATVTEATISMNRAGQPGNASPNGRAGAGSGIDVLRGEFTEINTIVSQDDCKGAIIDGFHDLLFAGSGCPAAVAADPRLGPLQNNSGPTFTMALGPGSAAIDQVPASGAKCALSDERGVPRPQGPACDIGAYEFKPGP